MIDPSPPATPKSTLPDTTLDLKTLTHVAYGLFAIGILSMGMFGAVYFYGAPPNWHSLAACSQ